MTYFKSGRFSLRQLEHGIEEFRRYADKSPIKFGRLDNNIANFIFDHCPILPDKIRFALIAQARIDLDLMPRLTLSEISRYYSMSGQFYDEVLLARSLIQNGAKRTSTRKPVEGEDKNSVVYDLLPVFEDLSEEDIASYTDLIFKRLIGIDLEKHTDAQDRGITILTFNDDYRAFIDDRRS